MPSDFVIVGGGLAGCLIAHELLTTHRRHVTLIEPSTPPATSLMRQPSRWLDLLGGEHDWGYATRRCEALAGRSIAWPRGRGLGGSTRINAMIWLPPDQSDLAMMARAIGDPAGAAALLRDAAARSTRLIRPEPPRWLSPAAHRFLQSAGPDDPRSDDRPITYLRSNRRGHRWTAADLLESLPPQTQDRLRIVDAVADRIRWKSGTSVPQAAGVVAVTPGGPVDVPAARGVVLAAGAIASPCVLMRSGIGQPERLADLGIDPVGSSPAVGHNLADHLVFPVVLRVDPRHALPSQPSTRDLATWQAVGGGPVCGNVAEVGGMFAGGTIQIHFTATHYVGHPAVTGYVSMGVSQCHPRSRGEIRLSHRDPAATPWIMPNYFARPDDLTALIEGVAHARRIAGRGPLAEIVRSEQIPGEKRRSPQQIAAAIGRYAQSLYHPCGTLAMGTDHSNCVVTPRFRVGGTRRLWVGDASVLPQITAGNPSSLVAAVALIAARSIATA